MTMTDDLTVFGVDKPIDMTSAWRRPASADDGEPGTLTMTGQLNLTMPDDGDAS